MSRAAAFVGLGVARVAEAAQSPRDISLDYLRATLTLMVVAHHSSLAYTVFARSDPHYYLASTAPVVDASRWLFLDNAENFNDVFFMSLMFFISGLFVLPSLRRSGPAAFLRARLLRLGLPFILGVSLLMPLAYFASWRQAGGSSDYLSYWLLNLTRHGWPPGPLWFVWVLLLFDLLAGLLFVALPRAGPSPDALKARPFAAFAAMVAIAALAYLPLLARYGFSAWGPFGTKPFYFQYCRIVLYFAWFGAGAWIGGGNLDRGLLARDGGLAQRRRWWLGGCVIAYNLLVFIPRLPYLQQTLKGQQLSGLEAVLWVVSCVASAFAFLALFRGLVRKRRRWMDSLSRSAYAIYLVHYVFVLWVQYALLGVTLPAGVKFLLVVIAATALSWVTAQALLCLPGAKHVL